MMRRASLLAAAPLLAAVLLGATACGPAGSLAPTVEPTSASTAPEASPTPTPSPTGSAPPVATETAASEPAPVPTAAPARTPPPLPALPVPSITGTEVPTTGPEPTDGSLLDYLVLCDPRIPMWFDDGDGRHAWDSPDRALRCEEGQIALIAVGVPAEQARLLTLFENDIGMPDAFRSPTLAGFDAAAVSAVAARTGVQTVDIEVSCAPADGGLISVGERYIYCTSPSDVSVTLTDVSLADALTMFDVGVRFDRELALIAS